jgi:FG-GAP-like repeat/FG-GAP repeat
MTDRWRPLKYHSLSSPPRSRRRVAARIARAFPLRPGFDFMEDRTLLSTFVVSNTGDSGPGSLRQAIIDSNSTAGETNTIDFNISGIGVQTVAPLTPLPAISNPVLLDGETQPGYSGTPEIELSGSDAGGGDGLTITGSDVTVRGLDINNFSQGAGIHLTGTSAIGAWICGNFVGTDPTGTQAEPNDSGVKIDDGAARNTVGTNGDGISDANERNILSGNTVAGVWIDGQGTDGNIVAGNFVGTSVTGNTALPNGSSPAYGYVYGYDGDAGFYDYVGGGVVITGSASGNRIGIDGQTADALAERNVISGNASAGVQVSNQGTSGNVVEGNLIGTDANGIVDLGNGSDGVKVESGAVDNTIGGTTLGAGNLITNNAGPGVAVTGARSAGDEIVGNDIFANAGQAIDLGGDGVTYNYNSPRQGPDNFQNFPIVLSNSDDQLQGWLGGSTPDTPFHIEFFASAGYGPGGSGEAEKYLGSLEVTTDGRGAAVFDVPYAPPAGLPIVTATATDPEGNTSEVTSLRETTAQASGQSVALVSGHSLIFSASAGDAVALRDPDAGPLDPAWDLTLSVAAGNLTLSTTAGLVGSGDGTGSLSYQGALSAVNAALAGMAYSPPAGFQGYTTIVLNARSTGAQSIQSQVVISEGVFVVTTTADNGPGSLRQAIDDANAAAGVNSTIDFDISGQGVHTIVLASQLPAITATVLIDGSSQPGYAGTPLINLGAGPAGNDASLGIDSSDVTIRGLAPSTDDFAVVANTNPATVTLPGVSLSSNSANTPDTYRIDTSTGGRLIALVQSLGTTCRLSLLDSQGHILVQSDGLSAVDPDDTIDEHLTAGTYFLQVESNGGGLSYSLTATLMPSASPFQDIATGDSPDFITTGDFNGDGILDLAVAITNYDYFEPGNTPSGGVSILLGNGDGTFRPPVEYAVGQDPVALTTGDFNGDGNIDIAVAEGGDSLYGAGEPGGVTVLLGNGNGTFQSQTNFYPVPGLTGGLSTLVAADFNDDGHCDLAVSTHVGVSILLGNGDGTFQLTATDAVGYYSIFAKGDFNRDGRADLAVVCEGQLSILLGNGDGTFQTTVDDAAGTDLDSIVAADFNGDGITDLAAGTDSGVLVLLGIGNGDFRTQDTNLGEGAGAISTGDFNGDGRLDLAVSTDSGLSVLLGNGSGTFRVLPPFPTGAFTEGDFNSDGRADLATYNNQSSEVSIILSHGDGTFGTLFSYAVGSVPTAVATADFNGDGRNDLATVNNLANDVSILLGNGDGTFQPAMNYAVGDDPRSVVTGDFNGDGRIDLAVVGFMGVSVLLGNGDGTFQPAIEYAAGTFPGAIVTGDFNGDGITDLAVANSGNLFFDVGDPGEVSILLGNGDGTFRPAVEYAAGIAPTAIITADFNGDGRSDLAVVDAGDIDEGGTYPGGLSILLGDGGGDFSAPVEYALGQLPNALTAGDFNGDGHIDIAVVDGGGGRIGVTVHSGVSVLMGNGDGSFQAQEFYPVSGKWPDSIAADDFNGDGRTDLAVADQGDAFRGLPDPSEVSVLPGNGDGTFGAEVDYPVGARPLSLVAGDFNGDGHTDLATADTSSNSISVLLGEGDGTFVDPGQLATTPQAAPLVADVNGDGTDDVLVVDGAGDILYRQGIPGRPGTFDPPVTVNPPLPDHSNPFTSRGLAWIPNTVDGPVIASVDAQDDAVSFYAYRAGTFVRVGSLTTGRLPAQIVAADLNGEGPDDLVVRNAGDGTLSVFFAANSIGPFLPQTHPRPFLPPLTLSVGVGLSDVQAVDTTGSTRLDLVVTNDLTGQISVAQNLGDRKFAAPVPYRAGTGVSEIDPGGTPELISHDATAGAAAGTLTLGGPTDLVSINPGSDTMGLLASLGNGRFANPTAIGTEVPAAIIRMGDFSNNGLDDAAVLTANGVSIYMADGIGGFLPPTTYAVPSEADGLTVADLAGNGKLDLLVGDAYGDVLVLLGKGDGTFEPYRDANQAVELAVADLTGNGSKDIIYADQGLDRVVVDYGAGNSAVLANQSTGLLNPGAVALADLNGDGVPDLIVANSGSNNVLIYPGLGRGQFGPAINDGNGYFVGTNPVGITVADLTGVKGALPDLVVADEGSNQVSILLNQSQKRGPISFSAGPRLNSGGSGPVSTVVEKFPDETYPDLLVTNSQSNDVMLLQGVGQGFFDDQNPQPFSVGADPGATFVGNFNGQTDLVTVNAGSNNLTLISGFNGPDPVTTTISSGGVDPDTAFAFESASGFEDLVIGNAGDGALALFEGSSAGLTLSSSETVSGLPSPTSLAFASVSGGQVQFYAATEGQEAAALVALSLGGGQISALSGLASPIASGVAQLVPLQESSLALVGTLLTVTIESSAGELTNSGVTEAIAALASSSAAPVSLGQPVLGRGEGLGGSESDESEPQAFAPEYSSAGQAIPAAPAWQRYTLGTDEALERFDRDHPDLLPAKNNEPLPTNPGEGLPGASMAPRASDDLGQSWVTTAANGIRAEAADIIIDRVCGEGRLTVSRHWWSDDALVCAGLVLTATDPVATARATCSSLLRSLAVFFDPPDRADHQAAVRRPIHRIADGGWALSGRSTTESTTASVSLILASVVVGHVYFGPAAQRARSTISSVGSRSQRHD